MEFTESKGIFLQIADSICDKVLEGKLHPGERVPSVRELAEEVQVNRNTVLRTYNFLEDMQIISNKRGIGYFVNTEAVKQVQIIKKEEFFNKELPVIINKIKLLKLGSNDLEELIKEINKNDNHENQ